MHRKRNRNLAALRGPFYADDGRVHAVRPGDFLNRGLLDVDRVVRRLVAVRALRRADGAEADGLDAVLHAEIEELRLLKAGVQLHLVAGGLDFRIPQHPLHFRYRHVGGADVAHQAELHQPFHRAPRLHVLPVDVGARVRVVVVFGAARRVVVRERPVHQVEVEEIQPQVPQGFFAGFNHVAVFVLVVPDL